MPLTLSTRTHGRSTTEFQNAIPAPATRRSWLSQLLKGETEPSPFAPAAYCSPRVSGLDAVTVARALGCPDLFLLDCTESNARERAMVNIARAAAERGERLLLISPDSDAADRLVESLAADRTLRVVRALAEDENPIRPTAGVTRLTSAGSGASRAEQLRREAAQTVAVLESRLAVLDRSADLHARLAVVEGERRTIQDRLERVETEVREQPAEPPARCREIQAEREKIRVRRAELERVPQSKSGVFARLFGFGRSSPDAAHSEELKQLAERDAALAAECAESTAKRLAEAVAERRGDFSRRLSALEAEAASIDAALRSLHPQSASEDTVENGSPSKATRMELDRELSVARTRQQELAGAGPDLARRLLAESQVVVATPGAVGTDPVFAVLGDVRFDRLILDHAEELTESAFDRFSPRARVCILAGDASPPPITTGRPPRGHAPDPSLLCRLAKKLDREPWRIEGDRLLVRLLPLTEKARAGLAREPLLDHPDVELGMATVDGEPVLAEIAFPAATSIPAAKSFLVSQLGEVVLHTCGEPEWRDGPAASWPHFHPAEGEWIDLMDGIRERVVCRGPMAFTAALEFDPANWDEATAKEWLAGRAAAASSRLAVLPCDRPARRPVYSR
ncbi:MAG: hypothetical protein U0791_07940 [Gemmataceae bacterium]